MLLRVCGDRSSDFASELGRNTAAGLGTGNKCGKDTNSRQRAFSLKVTSEARQVGGDERERNVAFKGGAHSCAENF